MPEWTDRQRAAIESRGQDLLVSAAAGSGKTAVMVERVKQLILRDRVPLSSILVMTFTNAAAAEMRMRIIETLESAQEQAGDADGFLREQLHTIDEAWICTLHSFCSRLLRRYYPVAGVDPGFRLLDEDEAAILEIAAMDDALSAAYESMPPGFDLLADAFGGRDGLALATQVSRLYRFAMSRAEGLGWLDGALGALRADEDAHAFQPRPSDARDIGSATLVVVNGLGFDDWMLRLAHAGGYKGTVTIASKGITTLEEVLARTAE